MGSEYIYLSGSEDVRHAATTISSAATEMSRAAASFEETLYRQRIWLDEWLDRLELVMTKEGDHE